MKTRLLVIIAFAVMCLANRSVKRGCITRDWGGG